MTLRRGAALLLIVASGCGGSLAKPDAAGTGVLPGDDAAVADVSVADAGGQADTVVSSDAGSGWEFLCGDRICTENQVCVMEYCGGGPNPCVEPTDGGACPDGWILDPAASCPSSGGGPGCYPPPCTNPPPHCANLPVACDGTPSCFCASMVCQFASCAFASGRTVTCAAI